MKRTHWIMVGVALAAAGAWSGRAAWRAHRDLVTLHVRNEPVAKVVRAMERQTRETILLDSNLNTRVTLELTDVPLRQALDRLAEKAGALAETVHAVYRSEPALRRLEQALKSGADGSQTGWTNLAPSWAAFSPIASTTGAPPPLISGHRLGESDLPDAVKEALQKGPGGPKVAVAFATNAISSGSSRSWQMSSAGSSARSGQMKVFGPSAMVVMRRGSGGNGNGDQTVVWSPERITLQASLSPQAEPNLPKLPSRTNAEAVARQVKGHCATLYALKKAPDGVGNLGLGQMGGGSFGFRASTNGVPLTTNLMDQVAARVQRDRLAQFQDLTPEERVQRARGLSAGRQN